MDLSILKSALAATCFINAAKEKLNIAVQVKAIEETIQRIAELVAEKLNLDAGSLKVFVDLYCQVSREIQSFLRKSDKKNYQFSQAESEFLACIKAKAPELEAAKSLSDFHNLLDKNNDETSKKVLNFARELITKTNDGLYDEIKVAAEANSLADVQQNSKEMKDLLSSIFLDKQLNEDLNELIQNWAEALSQCHLQTSVEHSFS